MGAGPGSGPRCGGRRAIQMHRRRLVHPTPAMTTFPRSRLTNARSSSVTTSTFLSLRDEHPIYPPAEFLELMSHRLGLGGG
jgi:hypothetical protein